ncbi:hypothetical protein Sgly_0441 [Syntrophobotulus glycolicus DSM 8271]|uniref:LuxR family transcriptional regulator n=2 Tax=Syntrophobotulus TaxID=51196 RepID=F0SY57_SYNGF|nr:hypothetical protein Sgly_0441 [Syntrophobotulus glycolicus DSM 8271]
MDQEKKHKLKQEYKQTPQPMGIFRLRNLVNHKILVGSSTSLDKKFNGLQMSLDSGVYPSKDLIRDWTEYGRESFVFEILDELEPRDVPDYQVKADLKALEELWLEKLKPFEERGYNWKNKNKYMAK